MTDEHYFTVKFDLGKVVVFLDDDGQILRVTFDRDDRYENRPSSSATAVKFADFLEGKGTDLDFKIDLTGESPFRRKVYQRVMEIPYGRTVSYGKVAADVGRPDGARAVGQAMAANRFPLIIPCHRVISGSGDIGGFSSGTELKRYLLKLEGLCY